MSERQATPRGGAAGEQAQTWLGAASWRLAAAALALACAAAALRAAEVAAQETRATSVVTTLGAPMFDDGRQVAAERRGGGAEHVAAFAAPLDGDGAPPSPTAAALRGVGAGRIEDPLPIQPQSGVVGFALIDIETGRLLTGRTLDQGLLPASVAKAPTAFYALDALGADHRFSTRVVATGPIENGVIQGALVLVGGGDPTFDSRDLIRLADAVEAAGITGATEGLGYDLGPAPEIAAIDPEQPQQAHYNPGVSGLNLNENRFLFQWTPQRGGPAELAAYVDGRLTPAGRITIAETEAPGGPAYRHRMIWTRAAPTSPAYALEAWSVRAAFRRQGRRWLPVRRPGGHAAEAFRALLEERGFEANFVAPRSAPADAREIARHESPPLIDITRRMLDRSTNITAEALGLAASTARGRDFRSMNGRVCLGASARDMNAWLNARYELDGETAEPAAFANHSGLSLESRVSARTMAVILARIARDEAGFETFFNTMPIYPHSTQAGRVEVRAKTGTVYFGRGLAGYMTCSNGRRLAFAYFNSDFDERARFDAGRARLHYNSTPGARRWLSRARVLERRLLADWTAAYCAAPEPAPVAMQ